MPKIDFGSVTIYIGFAILIVIAVFLLVTKFRETLVDKTDVSMYERPTWSEETESDVQGD